MDSSVITGAAAGMWSPWGGMGLQLRCQGEGEGTGGPHDWKLLGKVNVFAEIIIACHHSVDLYFP